MKKTVRKIFWIWDFEKEEKWLNEMSSKGWHLCEVTGTKNQIGNCTYVFQEGEAGNYIYRLELLNDLPTSVMGTDYIHFVEETGAEHIGSIFRWVYFRRKADSGEFNMFSDIDSRISHLNRILILNMVLFGVMLFSIANNIYWLMMRLRNGGGLVIGIFLMAYLLFLMYGLISLLLIRHKLRKRKILHE